jgi:methylaspartate mutase sigma subunit
MKSNTVVTGVTGDDIHVVGIKLIDYALKKEGFNVISLGILTSQKEFIDASIESDAGAILISSLNGHAESQLEGFMDKMKEAGLVDVVTYVGGMLTLEPENLPKVRKKLLDQGFTRVFDNQIMPDEIINNLNKDSKSIKNKEKLS